MQKKILLRQLDRVFNGPAWHGPSVSETLKEITERNALNKVGDSHTTVQLIAHMAAWRNFVIEKLAGNDAYDVSEDVNFPSKPNLQESIIALMQSQEKLMWAIEQFPEERLRDKVPHREYSFQTMLHGILHHDLYHLGQLGLLKK